METEIIKTDDPNILIERTIIEKEIDVEWLNNLRLWYIEILDWYNRQLEAINSKTIPAFLAEIVEKEKERIIWEKATYEVEIQRIDNILVQVK
jgi:hypothetical protein